MNDTFPVRVRVVIEYTTELVKDPKAYGGAKTPEAIAAKEKRYLEEGGDYLISGLQFIKHKATATVELVEGGE
jgi:hypothetical protein